MVVAQTIWNQLRITIKSFETIATFRKLGEEDLQPVGEEHDVRNGEDDLQPPVVADEVGDAGDKHHAETEGELVADPHVCPVVWTNHLHHCKHR